MNSVKAFLGSLSGVLLALSLVSCSPATNPSLTRVESKFASAQTEALAARNAPVAWQDAQSQLAVAQRSWREDRNFEETDHLAYLAEQKLEIARLKAAADAERDQRENLARQHGDVAALALSSPQGARGRTNYMSGRLRTLENELLDFQPRQTDRGLDITIRDVLFQRNSAELKPGAYRRLEPIARYLREDPLRTAAIEGHTDSSGSAAYNKKLSQERAEAVRALLIQQGVTARQLTAQGLGRTFPVASNATPAGRLQNRRVEVIIQ